jgi:hypothetical protein
VRVRGRGVCADVDEAKVERLRLGVVDILEPGLQELVAENQAAGWLEFVVGARAAEPSRRRGRAGGAPRVARVPLAGLGCGGGALAGRVVVDCRNLLDSDVLRRAGISWVGIGRR